MDALAPPFGALEPGRFRAILADPPWRFQTWSDKGKGRSAERHYRTMSREELLALPVRELAYRDCVLFLWTSWPHLPFALELIEAWGFRYKTGGFDWLKTTADSQAWMGNGYWTRANTEPCLLATRGHPARLNRDVRQVIVSRRRAHSQKPAVIHERIERLVPGPYLELFARQSTRPGWQFWGDELERFNG